MRVIAGEKKGLPLKSAKGVHTRPTSDKVKESLFNRIGPFFDGGIVAELFGGSGALSLETLSRGANEAYIFEKNRQAIKMIRENVEKCQYEKNVHIQQMDARYAVKFFQKKDLKLDLLFIDPPYSEHHYYDLVQSIVEADLLTEEAIIVCEHEQKLELPESYGQFGKRNCTNYGNIAITTYKK